jgi:thiamine-phosphate pyrophosphorylase
VPASSDITGNPETSCDSAPVPGDRLAALRMLDANLNRAAEGLRVAEDYCRFALNDSFLTDATKQVRHRLAKSIPADISSALFAARQTELDVGTAISTPGEQHRVDLAHVVAAAWNRVQQALRVIEECLKLVAPQAAGQVEQLRYRSYTLAKACTITAESRERLSSARLYVLIDGGTSECAFVERVQSLIAAGVDVLQLREKRLVDRTLLARAQLLRRIIDGADRRPLFIMNDRPDLAVLARADGVHLGQDELSVHDSRQIVGPKMLVGVSTHTIEQARQAVLDGANYIGCGPTFPSGTKHFEHFPGLDFLRQVAAEISLPAFAIGGITRENLQLVVDAGFCRVAVGDALSGKRDLECEVTNFLALLKVPNRDEDRRV